MNPNEPVCCPKCGHDLHFHAYERTACKTDGTYVCHICRREYECISGFIHFIQEKDNYHSSRRDRWVRSVYARFYTPLTNLMFLPCGGQRNARAEVIEHLELQPGINILETGIGTGDNIPFLNGNLEGGTVYGIDNQLIMLQKCARNCQKWDTNARLYLANAEELPFVENYFDLVFHLGAINLFKNKKKAIDEMIRVARPGSKIVIADETEKACRYLSLLIGKHEPVVPPVDLVPQEMTDLTLKEIWKGFGYVISFRKPVYKEAFFAL